MPSMPGSGTAVPPLLLEELDELEDELLELEELPLWPQPG